MEAPIPTSSSLLLQQALWLPSCQRHAASPAAPSNAAIQTLAARLASLPPSISLLIDGKSVPLPVPSQEEQDQSLIPLCLWLEGLRSQAHQEKRRVLVGVVGAAGAGKSYMCALLAGFLNHPVLFPSAEGDGGGEGGDGTRVGVLSMDAYHLRNEVLEAKGLKHLKGLPETIDAAGLLQNLRSLKQQPLPSSVTLPTYDRNTHDPSPGTLHISADTALVLVEGLHLLHSQTPWSQLQENGVLDLTLFIDIPKDVSRARVVERKVRNGRERGDAEEHFGRVDEPIFDRLQLDKERADLIIAFSSSSSSSSSSFSSHSYIPFSLTLRGTRLLSLPSSLLPSFKEEEVREERGEKPCILALGLNPCVQKVLRFQAPLKRGDVNRAKEVKVGVGGKGQNFTKAANVLGMAAVVVAQWLGGTSGAEVEAALRSWGNTLIVQQVKGATRTCCSLLHPQQSLLSDRPPLFSVGEEVRAAAAAAAAMKPSLLTTEIVEPGVSVTEEEQAGLLSVLYSFVSSFPSSLPYSSSSSSPFIDAVAVMGSLPAGVPSTYYAKVLRSIYASLPPSHPPPLFFLDTVVGLEAILAEKLPIFMLKVNAAEAHAITQSQPQAWLYAHPHVHYLAVTQGGEQARLSRRCRGGGSVEEGREGGMVTYVYGLPRLSVEELVNPIGAGDACSGATLSAALVQRQKENEREKRRAVEEEDDAWAVPAFRLGLAAASASCGEEENSTFRLERVRELESLITIEVQVTR